MRPPRGAAGDGDPVLAGAYAREPTRRIGDKTVQQLHFQGNALREECGENASGASMFRRLQDQVAARGCRKAMHSSQRRCHLLVRGAGLVMQRRWRRSGSNGRSEDRAAKAEAEAHRRRRYAAKGRLGARGATQAAPDPTLDAIATERRGFPASRAAAHAARHVTVLHFLTRAYAQHLAPTRHSAQPLHLACRRSALPPRREPSPWSPSRRANRI
jgi:hypothetical protein